MHSFPTPSLRSVLRFTRHAAVLLLLPGALHAGTVPLYEDGLGNTPGAQPWLAFFGLGGITESPVAEGVQLATDNSAQAGYSSYTVFPGIALKNPAFPSLDRPAGFQLSFELQVNSENHGSNDRAGYSVILLGSDHIGIELGFWTNTVFAQSAPSFTHAENVTFDNATAENQFDLLILGDSYRLSANGTEILSGSVRDYSAHPNPVYGLGSFVFLGDDTTSAGATVTLGNVALTSPVPEPGEWALMAVGVGMMVIVIGRRRVRRTRFCCIAA